MKQRIKIVPIDLYKRGVCVFVGTREQFRSYVERENLEIDWDNYKDIEEMAAAFTVRFQLDSMIVCTRKPEESVIVHEIVHAAKHILRIVDVDDEEAEAYLVEYLYDQIIPWLRTNFSSSLSIEQEQNRQPL